MTVVCGIDMGRPEPVTAAEMHNRALVAKKRMGLVPRRIVVSLPSQKHLIASVAARVSRDWVFVSSDKSSPSSTAPAVPKLAQVLDSVAFVTGVSAEEIKGPRRNPSAVLARQVFFYMARKINPLNSFGKIGKCCSRNHTTVAHGCRVIEARQKELSLILETINRHVMAGVDANRRGDMT